MNFIENPKYSLKTGFGTPDLTLPFSIKQHTMDIKNDLVDPDLKTWNTVIDCVLEWEPTLRKIYDEKEIRINWSD